MKERLVIRPFVQNDQLAVIALYQKAMWYYNSDIASPAVSSVLHHLVSARCGPGGDLFDIASYYQSIKDRRSNFFVAIDTENELKVIGMVGAIPSLEFPSDEYLELVGMAVDPDYHGSGVAALLVETFESWARQNGYQYVNLTTLDGMLPAIRFYSKLGYERCEAKDEFLDCTKYGSASGSEAHAVKLIHFVKSLR